MTRFLHILPAILLTITAGQMFAQTGWTLKSNKDNVKVYYRKTTDIHELKLTTSIKAPLSGLVLLFDEVELYPKWGYKVVSARKIKVVSNTEMYYQSKIDFPWPADDRDVVMHTKLEQNPTTKVIVSSSTAAPDLIPAEKDYLRMRNSRTTWTLVPSPDGWTYVEYYIYSSPGGTIPDWMINAAIDVGPRETIKTMKVLLQQARYQNAKLDYITN
jgi:START domain